MKSDWLTSLLHRTAEGKELGLEIWTWITATAAATADLWYVQPIDV